MLVLSRRESEKILFPSLGIFVEVLRVRGNQVRLGIDAPPEIPVIRDEIAKCKSILLTPDDQNVKQRLSDLTHTVRRRLDAAATELNRLHQHLDENENLAAQEIVNDLFRELRALEDEANRAIESAVPAAPPFTRALIVEDNIIERKLMASYLELSGFDVVTASDGQDAIEYLSMHAPPNVVLLDLIMPRCDGLGFVKEVRSNPRFDGLKIFAVSSTEPSTLGVTTGRKGINGWFRKPVEAGDVVKELNRQLSSVA